MLMIKVYNDTYAEQKWKIMLTQILIIFKLIVSLSIWF